MDTMTQPKAGASTLTPAQEKAYREDGYIHLKGLFSPDDVAAWDEESKRLTSDRNLLHEENWRSGFRKFDDGTWRLDKLDPVIDVSPVFQSVVEDPRLLGAVAGCFGEEGKLFKDKIIFKQAGQTGFAPHQDWNWWQPFPQDLLSAMVAIDGAFKENGALQVYAGEHHKFMHVEGKLDPFRKEELERMDEDKWKMIETEPGDVILFHCLTPHRSGTNVSNVSRRQLYLTYSPAKHGDLYKAHYEHYLEYYKGYLDPFFQDRLFFR